MKTIKTTLLAVYILAGGYSFSQTTTTLQNLAPTATRTATKYTGSGWGYWTGVNSVTRDGYAEKYYIRGTGKVLGVISEHKGKVRPTSSKQVQFKIFKVGTNRLPSTSTSLASKDVAVTKLDLTGQPMTTMFTTPASVADSFFVALLIWDYAHETLYDTVAVLHGVDGSRPDSDLKVFGRNAVRQHSHDPVPPWKDLRTQNFTSIKTHLALFPIMEGTIIGVSEFKTDEFQVKSVYPNPFVEKINVAVNPLSKSDLHVTVFDELGKEVVTQTFKQADMADGNLEVSCPSTLAKGTYVLFIKGASTGVGFTVVKN